VYDRGTLLAKIKRRTTLNTAVADIFAYIADFRTLKDYNPSILQVKRLVEGHPSSGDRYELTLPMFGRKIYPVLTVTEFKENQLIETKLDAFIPAIEHRLFKQVGNETDFQFTIEFASGWPIIGTLLDWILIKLFAGRQADTEIRLLEKRFNRDSEV